MSIPTHNLYDFVHQATKRQFYMFYFKEWGNKSLENLVAYQENESFLNGVNGIPLQNRLAHKIGLSENHYYHIKNLQPTLLCHDQEPLNFSLYTDDADLVKQYKNSACFYKFFNYVGDDKHIANLNLRWTAPMSFQRHWILLHSELNSKNTELYENTDMFKTAYWWSHAFIAKDWYRFAEYDDSLAFKNNNKKLFLCYARDTTGSRSYRKTVLNKISTFGLQSDCILASDTSNTGAALSATYDANDITASEISVVLETVADERIHLTEKTLRPIATGHPFILLAGPGALQTLKTYGFKTFAPYINEAYDNEQDLNKRMHMIANEMLRLKSMPVDSRNDVLDKCREIATYNKAVFFSKEFENTVINELKTNVEVANNRCSKELDFTKWWNFLAYAKKHGTQVPVTDPRRKTAKGKIYFTLLRKQRQGKLR